MPQIFLKKFFCFGTIVVMTNKLINYNIKKVIISTKKRRGDRGLL
jgi:hypothetical protein